MNTFFFIPLSLIFAFSIFSSNASNYYLSQDGNDSNPGTSPEMPWKSLQKLNKMVPKPGDSILFRKGNSWNGTIHVNMFGKEDKHVVYGSYGTGEKPRIYGSEIITGWSKKSENIYVAGIDEKVNQVFLDDNKLTAAKYPDSGYIYITSVSDSITFLTNELNPSIDYSGALWFGRTNYFTTSLLEIESSDSKVLKIKEKPRFPLKKGLGFFLMNKIEFLSKPGEWFYDEKENLLYLYLEKGDTPENYTIRSSIHEDGLKISRRSYITVNGLHFLHQSKKAIHLQNSSFISIENNAFTNPDGFAIYSQTESTGFRIFGNKITGANHYGMYLRASNSLISGNQISNIALFDDIGITGTGEDNFGGGIYIAGEKGNNIISYNTLEKIGFNGILFARPKNIIEYNFINEVCLLKGDMGAIYTSWYNRSAADGPNGSIIRNNIILNVLGEKEGYTSARHMGEGIYIDESASGVLVENNTIAHCTNSGIKLHKTEGVVVDKNIIFDTRQAVHILNSEGIEINRISNNTLIASNQNDDYLKNQVLVNLSSGKAIFEGNEYISLFPETDVFMNGSKYLSFKKWQISIHDDTASKAVSLPLSKTEKEILLYNRTNKEKRITLNGRIYKTLKGEEISGEITLLPYTSLILIGKNSEKIHF